MADLAAVTRELGKLLARTQEQWPDLPEAEKLKLVKSGAISIELMEREALSPRPSKVREECRKRLWNRSLLGTGFGEHRIKDFGVLEIEFQSFFDIFLEGSEEQQQWLSNKIDELVDSTGLSEDELVWLWRIAANYFNNHLGYYIGTAVRNLLGEAIDKAGAHVIQDARQLKRVKKLKDHFAVTVKGRPIGSKKQVDKQSEDLEHKERYELILRAIRTLYADSADYSRETKTAIARQAGISRRTLNRWSEEYGWTIDELLREALDSGHKKRP